MILKDLTTCETCACVFVSDLVPQPSFVSAVDAVEARVQSSIQTARIQLIHTDRKQKKVINRDFYCEGASGCGVCEVRPGRQRPSVVLWQLRRCLVGLQVKELEDVDFPFDADLQQKAER